jgi:hypothetical protein
MMIWRRSKGKKMITPKRMKDKLTWIEPTYPPRPKRKALFSLIAYGDEIYFVNDSDEILTSVSTESSGFFSVDDETTVGTEKNPGYSYADVLPSEAVKVEEYDKILDSDFVLGLDVYVESKRFGKIHIRAKSHKGGVLSQPLMWEDGSFPRGVWVEEMKS